MFFQGDLQSGIALAIQQQKLVACFVRQEGDAESDTWEHEWLKESLEGTEQNKTLLAQKAVLLRIDKGSQEAGFLSAFSAVDNVPKLVIISNGRVLEDIESGTSQEDFVSRIASACGQEGPTTTTTAASSTTAVPRPTASGQAQPSSSNPDHQAQASNPQIEALLAERRAKLEKVKKEKEQAEREARRVIAKARREEAEKDEATAIPNSRQNYVEQQRTRQKEARSEKERVLRMIESDRAARREKDEQRRMLAQSESASTTAEAGSSASSVADPSSRNQSTICALQIRLFDGTSIRSRFSPDVTLTSAVRTFVSENSTTDIPYNFRHMQTPLPSRTIDVAEENEPLHSLGLCPSATLVLVPVKDYADAYATGGVAGMLNRGIGMGYGLVSGAFGLVGGAIGRVTGYGGDATSEGPYVAGTGDEQEPSNVQGGRMAEESATPGGPGLKIRTLADQRRENESNEFYNGNQLNFEPRKDEDKKD